MDRDRFSRQIVLPDVGEEGQSCIGRAFVALVGVGGIGCPSAIALASAGIGGLRLIDPDRVERSNLPRQWLYREADIGRLKVEAAAASLAEIGVPGIRLELRDEALKNDNAVALLEGCDLVIDGSDRFASRYATSAAAAALRIPALFGAVQGFVGQLLLQPARGKPCYRCAFPDPPDAGLTPSCSEAGILAPVPATIAQLACIRALGLLLGQPQKGELLRFDFRACQCRSLSLEADPDCPGCGQPTSRRPANGLPVESIEISPEELEGLMSDRGKLVIIDVRTEVERIAGTIDGDRHIPLRELGNRVDDLDQTEPLVLYCSIGQRSLAGAEMLRRSGIEALSLRGGFRSWRAHRSLRDEATTAPE